MCQRRDALEPCLLERTLGDRLELAAGRRGVLARTREEPLHLETQRGGLSADAEGMAVVPARPWGAFAGLVEELPRARGSSVEERVAEEDARSEVPRIAAGCGGNLELRLRGLLVAVEFMERGHADLEIAGSATRGRQAIGAA